MTVPRTYEESGNNAASSRPTAQLPLRSYASWFRILVPLGTFFLLALLTEAAFHVVPNTYQELVPMGIGGAWHAPGRTFTYYGAPLGRRQPPDVAPNVVRWNGEGWHDIDHDLIKPPGTVRVLVLGDSFVEGVQVRLYELYHRRLERLLQERDGTVEVIAMANSGWSQEQELKALVKAGLRYRPDLVLVEFLAGNDVRTNHPELERMANDQAYRSTKARTWFIWALDRGLLFPAFLFDRTDLALRQISGEQGPIDSDVYRAEPRTDPELWSRAWDRTADLLDELHAVSSRAGAEFAVVAFTSIVEISAGVSGASRPEFAGMDMRLPARKLMALCTARGLACLDLGPRFAALPVEERKRLHLEWDGHWSRYGHDRAARETVAYLMDETSLWQRVRQRQAAERR